MRQPFFVGQVEISLEWLGNFGPGIRLLGTVTAFLTCSWPWGKNPLALVLLKDGNGRLFLFPFATQPRCRSSALGGFCCYGLWMLWGEWGKHPLKNACYGLKSTSFRVTQISLFWHKHPATERKGKEVLIGCYKLFIIVERNNQPLPFIVK